MCHHLVIFVPARLFFFFSFCFSCCHAFIVLYIFFVCKIFILVGNSIFLRLSTTSVPQNALLSTSLPFIMETCEVTAVDVRNLGHSILRLLDSVKDGSSSQSELFNTEYPKIVKDLEQFQELPQLLDPILTDTVPKLTALLPLESVAATINNDNQWTANLVYLLCKIRGYKVITRFFSSDISYLTTVVQLLESNAAKSTWQYRYCLLLWLSVLILAPFSLETFGNDLKNRLYKIAYSNISIPGKERDAASILLARLVTRGDTKTEMLPMLVQSVSQEWESSSVFFKIGILRSFAIMVNRLDPVDVHAHLKSFFTKHIIEADINGATSTPVFEKLVAKCLGRLAVCFVKNDLADESTIEDIVGNLLERLSGRDTIVRLAASKQLANVTQCLPEEMQPDIIDMVFSTVLEDIPELNDSPENLRYLDQFNSVSLTQWHGTLLLIAEFLRRRLNLLTEKYDDIVQIVQAGLIFEQRKLTYAAGSNVRDAACFVAWALFRAFTDIPANIFESLIEALAAASSFDREINIRRAASAAIQEGIGRHPDASKGIPVVQTLDFFKLGNREQSFLVIAPKLYDLGYHNLVNFLVHHSIYSWDPVVAKLAGRALGIFSKKNAETRSYIIAELAKFAIDKYSYILGPLYYAFGEIRCARELQYLTQLASVQKFTQEDHELAEGYVHFLADLVQSHSDELVVRQLEQILRQKTWTSFDDDIKKIAHNIDVSLVPVDQWLEHVTTAIHGFIIFLSSIDKVKIPNLVLSLTGLINDSDAPMRQRCTALEGLGIALLRYPEDIEKEHFDLVLSALDDYTTGPQGDIGSWLRKSAISVGLKLAPLDKTGDFVVQFVKRLLRISVELLDTLRIDAVSALTILSAKISPSFFNFFSKTNFLEIIDNEFAHFFSSIILLLDLPELSTEYYNEFAKGFVYTAGARYASEGILKQSFQALSVYLATAENAHQCRLWKYILFLASPKHSTPVYVESANRLISELVEADTPVPDGISLQSIFVAAYNAHLNTNAIANRVLPSIKTFAGLALLDHEPSLKRLVLLCASPRQSPVVRTAAAEALYEVFLEQGNEELAELVSEESFEELKQRV